VSALEQLHRAELFAHLGREDVEALAATARARKAHGGEVLFRVGDVAEEVYVIERGRVDLTFPLVVRGETKDVRFQSIEPGRALAWSALVPPHRMTLSARASTEVELLALPRAALLALFERRPAIGYAVMASLCRVVAGRYQEMAALWVKELQRNVAEVLR
jgi:CRP-like cAMP-binding protein